MNIYEATTPPSGATCDTPGDSSAAVVRLLIPASRFTADGVDHSKDPPIFDACGLHWPGIRDACLRNGHQVIDTTGDLRHLVADFPGWNVFHSDGGRLYASARRNGSGHGTTLHAFLVSQLREQLENATPGHTARLVDPSATAGGGTCP